MLLCLQRLLLVVALLFSQQVASAHAQDHQLKGTASDQQVCEQCVLAAHLGAAPTTTPAQVACACEGARPIVAPPCVFHPGAFAPFSSRAPPVLA